MAACSPLRPEGKDSPMPLYDFYELSIVLYKYACLSITSAPDHQGYNIMINTQGPWSALKSVGGWVGWELGQYLSKMFSKGVYSPQPPPSPSLCCP